MKITKLQICILLLTLALATINSFPQSLEDEAQKAISGKNFKKAREIYSKLSQEKPENLSFVLWTARLSAWLGDYKTALKVYDEVLQKYPTNNEALLGKAYVLMWQKKYGKAKEILALAEKNGRYDTAFLVAKINFFRYQNKIKESRELVNIAKESGSANVEIEELGQILEKTAPKTYQVGCEQNFEPFTAMTTACFVNLNIQNGANNFTLKTQSGKRFGKFYQDFGVNWRREIDNKLSININAVLEPKKISNLDMNFGANYQINKRLNVGADYRLWRLNKKNINILSTNIIYSINNETQVQATFYKSSNNVLMIRANRQISKPLNLGFTYLRTFENKRAENYTFSQNALVLSGKYQISKNLNLSGSYGLTQKGAEPYRKIYGFGFTLTK